MYERPLNPYIDPLSLSASSPLRQLSRTCRKRIKHWNIARKWPYPESDGTLTPRVRPMCRGGCYFTAMAICARARRSSRLLHEEKSTENQTASVEEGHHEEGELTFVPQPIPSQCRTDISSSLDRAWYGCFEYIASTSSNGGMSHCTTSLMPAWQSLRLRAILGSFVGNMWHID